MAHKKVFVSFDYEHDRHYRYLLAAWHANPDFEFVFNDMTPSEIQTDDIGRIKAGLTVKINQSTYTLVLLGQEADKRHRDSVAIGCRNWINFEIQQSRANFNKIIAVKLPTWSGEYPEELLKGRYAFVAKFGEAEIIDALKRA